jgi:hypothetical protein
MPSEYTKKFPQVFMKQKQIEKKKKKKKKKKKNSDKIFREIEEFTTKDCETDDQVPYIYCST